MRCRGLFSDTVDDGHQFGFKSIDADQKVYEYTQPKQIIRCKDFRLEIKEQGIVKWLDCLS